MENKILLANIEEINKACTKVKSFVEEIVDENSFVETDVFLTGKSFDNSLEALGEGVITGYATIGGKPVHLFAQNSEVLKGSLSKAHADKINKAIQRAIKSDTPFISIVDSVGARIGEGTSIMEGYAQIVSGCIDLECVPHICVVKGAGVGMMATYVAGADWTFMSKDSVVSFGSPMSVLYNDDNIVDDYSPLGYNGYKSSNDLATFEYKNNADLKTKINNLLDILSGDDSAESSDDPNRVSSALNKDIAVDKMVDIVFDKDSVLAYCPEYASDVKCYLAKINGIRVGVVANDDEYMSLKGIDKMIAFINKIDEYNIPLITLVDTKGIKSTLDMEYNSVAKKTYELMRTISNMSTPKLAVAVGNAIGFGYSALMSKAIGFEYSLATNKAIISPVASSVVVAGMMNDQLASSKNPEELRAKLQEKYDNINASPMNSAQEGYVDNVIEAQNLRPYIASALLMLLGI